MRKYSDDQLISAVPASRSWRGVLEILGLKGTSAGSLRSVRRHADRLGLDYSHFTGQRRWSDRQLKTAVAAAETWTEVLDNLGLSTVSGTNKATIRNHSVRLCLDTTHLDTSPVPRPAPLTMSPSITRLPRAGSLMAAAWFELCGHRVSWPLEPARYDLLVWRNDRAERVQVKTTTRRSGATWSVQLRTNRKQVHTYSPAKIDHFFIVDGDYRCYLIPLKVVAGFGHINLSAYAEYRLPDLRAPTTAYPQPRTPRPGSS